MRLFGTDGIRGRVNAHPMTPETILKVGLAAARVLKNEHGRNMVLIGKDTRQSGYMIESALTSGICSMGMDVTLLGPVPTPGVAYLTRVLRADAGFVISASHNPFDDNGIKIFSHEGLKLPDEMERRIEEMVAGQGVFRRRPGGDEIGKAHRLDDALGRYIEFVKSTVPGDMMLDGIKVVVDCANGAAYKVTPQVLEELGAEVMTVHDKPDGTNINRDCGSLHVDKLAQLVKEFGADVGIAHDGDADRTLFCDEKGAMVDGDHMMGMLAVQMQEAGTLKGGTVVSTVMSNIGLERFLGARGLKLIRTRVGDRYVTARMVRDGYNLGGEQSGHIVMFDYNTTGDGPITALQVLALMASTGRKLSELAADIEIFPQVLQNVVVEQKTGWNSDPDISAAIKDVEHTLGKGGRVLVRASGTESLIRVMIEGQDDAQIKKLASGISKVIKQKIG
ncbi:MAG: phosphoglucosamine mutase [Thermodesulfovibrionales bacterium]|nr:phosphoglucosamine mutase [Thermodesulfovibrionales bacterium]